MMKPIPFFKIPSQMQRWQFAQQWELFDIFFTERSQTWIIEFIHYVIVSEVSRCFCERALITGFHSSALILQYLNLTSWTIKLMPLIVSSVMFLYSNYSYFFWFDDSIWIIICSSEVLSLLQHNYFWSGSSIPSTYTLCSTSNATLQMQLGSSNLFLTFGVRQPIIQHPWLVEEALLLTVKETI